MNKHGWGLGEAFKEEDRMRYQDCEIKIKPKNIKDIRSALMLTKILNQPEMIKKINSNAEKAFINRILYGKA